MRRVFAALSLLGWTSSSLIGCAHHRRSANFISVGSAAAGRVAIYRSGVAFFERTAKVVDGKLSIRVPRERVDDFLKSLKVVDAATNEPVAITIPRDQSDADGNLTMQVETAGMPASIDNREREVIVTYVTESPAWKPSYRVVVAPNGVVELEGWAIVDNTSGEDWTNVQISVGASSALSFRYDLWQVRNVDRELLGGEERLAMAPPTGDSSITDTTATKAGVTLSKEYISSMPIAGRSFEGAILTAPGSSSDEYGVSVAGTTSAESTYIVDGINTTGLALGNSFRMQYDAMGTKRDPRFGALAGIVTNSQSNGAPAVGARVEVSGGTLKIPLVAKTDARGAFRFDSLSPGQYQVKVVARGQSSLINSIAVAAGRTSQIAPHVDASAVAGNTEEFRQQSRWVELIPKLQKDSRGVLISAVAPTQQQAKELADATRSKLISSGIATDRITVETAAVADVLASVKVEAVNQDNASAQPAVNDAHFTAPHPLTVKAGSSAMVATVRGSTKGGEVYLYDPISARGSSTFAFRAVRLANPSDAALETGPMTVYGDGRFIGEGITESIAPHATAIVPFALDKQVVVRTSRRESDVMSRVISVDRKQLLADVAHRHHTTYTITNRLPVATSVLLRHTIPDGFVIDKAPDKSTAFGSSRLFELRLPAGQTITEEVIVSDMRTTSLPLNDSATIAMLHHLDASSKPDGLRKVIDQILDNEAQRRVSEETLATLRAQLRELREHAEELQSQIVTLRAVRTPGPILPSLQKKLMDISNRTQSLTVQVVETEQQLMFTRMQASIR